MRRNRTVYGGNLARRRPGARVTNTAKQVSAKRQRDDRGTYTPPGVTPDQAETFDAYNGQGCLEQEHG